MNELTATVFDIQKFSVHDGPGIRTTVFFKGCPLHCLWCHNPESQSVKPEIFYNKEKCISCGACVQACPNAAHSIDSEKGHLFDRSRCIVCGTCADVCPASALELCGKKMTVSEVMAEVLKDLPFYRNSGGGITLSGGEPMMCFDFTYALLQAAKQGKDVLDTAMETCGFAPVGQYEKVLPLVNLFLFDIKSLIPENHRKFTGVPLEAVLESLHFLDRNGAKIALRSPLIPGLNDSDAELRLTAKLAESLSNVQSIDLEPYHPLGVSKADRLGKTPAYSAPFAPKDYADRIADFLKNLTHVPVRKA